MVLARKVSVVFVVEVVLSRFDVELSFYNC